jgi:rare lipoprotein A
MDLSKRSAIALGYKQQGTAPVRVRYIGPAPLNDNGIHLMAMNRELKNGTPLRQMIAAANGRAKQNYEVAQAETVQEVQNDSEPVPQFERAAPSAVNYYVQAGIFADPDNAERLRQEFVNIGPVQVAELTGPDGPVYRMRVGPFDNLGDAQVALNQVYGYGLPDAQLLESHLQQASLQ